MLGYTGLAYNGRNCAITLRIGRGALINLSAFSRRSVCCTVQHRAGCGAPRAARAAPQRLASCFSTATSRAAPRRVSSADRRISSGAPTPGVPRLPPGSILEL